MGKAMEHELEQEHEHVQSQRDPCGFGLVAAECQSDIQTWKT